MYHDEVISQIQKKNSGSFYIYKLYFSSSIIISKITPYLPMRP